MFNKLLKHIFMTSLLFLRIFSYLSVLNLVLFVDKFIFHKYLAILISFKFQFRKIHISSAQSVGKEAIGISSARSVHCCVSCSIL
jgi:hypothetical protein